MRCPNQFPTLPSPDAAGDIVVLSEKALKAVRTRVGEVATQCDWPNDRAQDFTTAVSEGAMNAVQHAGGGLARVYIYPDCTKIQVWIEDQGTGIDLSNLPRATLERGYSTGGIGFGHGFWLMLQTSDPMYLLTGPSGTTVVLEQQRIALEPSWFDVPG